jgi:twitching motility protein PilT
VFDIDAALRKLVSRGGSDLHLKAHSPPLYRIYATFGPTDDEPALTPEDTEEVVRTVMADPAKQEEFERENEADFSFEIADVSRFRVNAFRQRGLVSLAFRAIPNEIRTIEELQLPEIVRKLAEEERGIILLTGTTGSGKSTTLAAMINHMNETMNKHIVTIEDPIEYVHADKRSAINQREIGMDTASFGRAMRRVLRQDPDVVLIGEMRDEETVRAALSAAETGHLVLSTVHTLDASESINRILDFFPPHQHNQARAMIAGTLKGVISQRLVQSTDGKRVAVCEVLVMTGRVRDMIKDPEQMGKMGDVIFSGAYYGMQTFDQALFKHVKAKRVAYDDAMRVATSPHDFKLLLEADGKRGTTMEDVAEAAAKRPSDGAPSSPPPAPAKPGEAAEVAPGVAPVTPGAGSPAGANGAPAGGVTPGVGNGTPTADITPGVGTATPTAAGVTPGVAATAPSADVGNGAPAPQQSVADPANVSAAAANGAPSEAGGAPGVSNGAPPAGNAAAGSLSAGVSAGASPAAADGTEAVQVGAGAVLAPPAPTAGAGEAGLTAGAGVSAGAAPAPGGEVAEASDGTPPPADGASSAAAADTDAPKRRWPLGGRRSGGTPPVTPGADS